MKRFLVALPILFLLFPIATAQEWWNSSWHFRFPVNISSSLDVENAKVTISMDFAYLLESLNISGTFDPNSIRVIEGLYEHPYDWENETFTAGNISWIANGTTPANTNRTFWIYFDVVENGEKPTGKLISEKPYWRSGYTNNMDVYSPIWNRSWAKLVEIKWKWSTEITYDTAYLYVNGSLVRQKDGVGSEIVTFVGNSVQARFTSDASITNPTTDEYGTYGCAVDWIRFYPVTNYTTPLLIITIGNASKQKLINWLELPEDGSLIDKGEKILIKGYITDENLNLLSNVTVNFTLSDGNVDYTCVPIEEDGYYSCLWDSSDKPLGNYSIRMDSYKQYYSPNSTVWVNRFTLRAGPPIINITLSSDLIERYSWVQINASVEDQSGSGINWTKVNIIQPNGNLEELHMIEIESNIWSINYTNTSQRGEYRIIVSSSDNIGRVGESNTTLKVSIKFNVTLKTQRNFYYQGDSGRIEFSLRDDENNLLQGANVTFEIRNPNNNLVYTFSGVTNSNGTVEPMPTFTIADSDMTGNYSLISITTYFDPLVNISITKRDYFSFAVLEREMIVSFFTLNLESPSEVEVGKSLEIFAMVTDGVKNVDVEEIKVSLYDSLDNLILENVSMERISTGIYRRSYSTSSSSAQGNWKWVVTAKKGPNILQKVTFTRVVGGPFDVRNITILDDTVPDIAIMVEIENKGNVGQDAFIEWKLTKVESGEILAAGAETVFIPANSIKTHTIYPVTNYLGSVKITFLVYYSGTERAGAYLIFTTRPAPSPPLPAMPTMEVVRLAVPKIEIVEWTKEIEIERGWIGFLLATVKNVGEVDLPNITVSVKGIDASWVEVPENFSLKVGENRSISVKFAVPINVPSGNYKGVILVSSLNTKDEKEFLLRVFASRAELIYYQIQTLKQSLKDLINKTLEAEKEGKDVKMVKEMLDIIRENIGLAEKYLDRKMYDEASEMVRLARNQLEKANYELQILQPIAKPFYEVVIEDVKRWFALMVFFISAGIFAIVYLMIKSKKQMEVREELSLSALKNVLTRLMVTQKLEREKERIEKILSLLEKQYREGLISEESYRELKMKNEELLSQIKKKLREV